MNARIALHVLAATTLAWTLSARPSNSAAEPSRDAAWNANGATACERFLTPAVMSAVLNDPSGPPTKDSATSCHRGAIYIELRSQDPAALKREIPRIAFAHPLTGVGDAAYWNDAGATTAAKAPDRGCVVQAILAVSVHDTKITGEALGQKLGEVCNTLFALK